MHAVYMFLVDTENFDPEEDLGAQAVAHFEEEYSCNLDENNWWTAMSLVTKDGGHYPIVGNGDWRGRNWLPDMMEDMPAEERWEWTIHFGFKLLATDLEVLGTSAFSFGGEEDRAIDTATNEQIINAIFDECPRNIAEILSDRIGVLPTETFDIDLWSSAKKLKVFNEVSEAYVRKMLPFCDVVNPYQDIRVMNLDYCAPDSPSVGVLFVDIHT
jgi:hypothetical protein